MKIVSRLLYKYLTTLHPKELEIHWKKFIFKAIFSRREFDDTFILEWPHEQSFLMFNRDKNMTSVYMLGGKKAKRWEYSVLI